MSALAMLPPSILDLNGDLQFHWDHGMVGDLPTVLGHDKSHG